jgi:hypothetical protein
MNMHNQIKTIKIFEFAGSFAQNKDKAKEIRQSYILPTLEKGKEIILDYKDVNDTTQSFTHALITEAIRLYGIDVLYKILFKNCNKSIQNIIEIVTRYMQQSIE